MRTRPLFALFLGVTFAVGCRSRRHRSSSSAGDDTDRRKETRSARDTTEDPPPPIPFFEVGRCRAEKASNGEVDPVGWYVRIEPPADEQSVGALVRFLHEQHPHTHFEILDEQPSRPTVRALGCDRQFDDAFLKVHSLGAVDTLLGRPPRWHFWAFRRGWREFDL